MQEPTDGEAIEGTHADAEWFDEDHLMSEFLRDQEPLSEEEIQEFYDFWGPIVCPYDGRPDTPARQRAWNHEQIMRELLDYHRMLDNVPKVYCEVTGGRMSKPHYRAEDVIREHGDWCYFGRDLNKVRELAERALDDPGSIFDMALMPDAPVFVEAITKFAEMILVAMGDWVEAQ